jgi:chromosomal replication initiation ATPase DnaA
MAYLTPDDIAACEAILARHRGAVATIYREVAEATGIPEKAIRSRSRKRAIVLARQMVMFAARKNTTLTLPQIGNAMGLDHTTVMYGIRAEEARRSAS